MSNKVVRIIIVIFVAAIVVAGAVFFAQSSLSNKQYNIELIVKSRQEGFEFWEIVRNGGREAAKEFNVDLRISGPASEEDIDGQIELLRKAVGRKPDAIVLAAVDQEVMLPYAQEVKDAGITLILVDSGLSENIEDCFVGTDNYTAAEYVAEQMAEAIGEQGDIVVISHQKATSTGVQRNAGFEDAMKQYPGVNILASYDIGDSVERSRQQTLAVLAEYPDLDGIYATNQISAEGVTLALEEAGREDLPFYAFDSSTTQNEALEDGIVDGFAIQKPFNMGYMSVKAAVDALNRSLREKNIDTGFEFATKENMREEEIQKLIYPFV